MPRHFHTIIIGLGGMGSAIAAHLARRGLQVLGLEQGSAPHELGSSHGKSRVIRQAYFEDPAYVPLLLRAYELWRELEKQTNLPLLTITGGLMLGREHDVVVAGSLRSAQEYQLPHELLDAQALRKRFPQFNPTPETVALYERNAGVIRPEAAITAHLRIAAAAGAELHMNETVLDWESSADGVTVRTNRKKYQADQLVLAAGPWLGEQLRGLSLPIRLERQLQFWFEPKSRAEEFSPSRFPVWLWQADTGGHPYGIPALDGEGCVKCALHHSISEPASNVAQINREVSESEIAHMRETLERLVPSLAGRCVSAKSCIYTTLPDEHFLIDRHPQYPAVLIVSPCSGHGFKFCPVIGEIAADLLTRNETHHPISIFNLTRLMS
jgi:sarcosine oxidase